VEIGEEPTVATAAAIFKKYCYNYRDRLLAGIIVAGWDKYNGGQVGLGLVNVKPVFKVPFPFRSIRFHWVVL